MTEASKIPGSSKDELLEHELRREIYDIVQERPGLNKNQIAEELGTYASQISFHLDRLVVNGVLEEVHGAQGEILLFLPSQEELWQDEQTLILYGREAVRAVAMYVVEEPGAIPAEVAEAMDRTPATARHHLRALDEHELVQSIRIQKGTTYHPSPKLESWFEQVGHQYERPWKDDDGDGDGDGDRDEGENGDDERDDGSGDA